MKNLRYGLWLVLPLTACMSKQQAAQYVTLTAVVSPIAEQAQWQPVNAGINPAYHRLQSPLGSIELYDHPTPVQALSEPLLLAQDAAQQQALRIQLQQQGATLLGDPVDEVLSLAGQDFLYHRYRVRHANGSRHKYELYVGVVQGKPLQITVQIDDDVDAKSYEALQAVLNQQVAARQ